MQDRKKIYSEQLLQIHTDSKKRNPGKEIYATGYVIELKKDCYFAGFKEGKILCRSLEYARYFFNIHSAEQFVKEYLGYAGLRRFAHFQALEQDVQRRLVVVIILVDFSSGDHFHDHREVLFFGRASCCRYSMRACSRAVSDLVQNGSLLCAWDGVVF